MTAAVVVLCAFVIMEPVAAATHRLVMHGCGWGWHRSHHVGRHRGLERNDRYPLAFASIVVMAMAIAAVAGSRAVLAAGAGVSGYGLAYLVVHDVCVHGRLSGGHPVLRGGWLRRVAAAHAVHHRTGRAPYGFLVPVVPHRVAPVSG